MEPDLDPLVRCCGSGICYFLTPGSVRGKKFGSGIKIPGRISDILVTVCLVTIPNSLSIQRCRSRFGIRDSFLPCVISRSKLFSESGSRSKQDLSLFVEKKFQKLTHKKFNVVIFDKKCSELQSFSKKTSSWEKNNYFLLLILLVSSMEDQNNATTIRTLIFVSNLWCVVCVYSAEFVRAVLGHEAVSRMLTMNIMNIFIDQKWTFSSTRSEHFHRPEVNIFIDQMWTFNQCCGSGIRDWVPFWPRYPGWEKVSIRIRDPGWTTRIIFFRA